MQLWKISNYTEAFGSSSHVFWKWSVLLGKVSTQYFKHSISPLKINLVDAVAVVQQNNHIQTFKVSLGSSNNKEQCMLRLCKSHNKRYYF